MGDGAGGEIVAYEGPDGDGRINVRLERDTAWFSLAQMEEL